MQSFPSTLSIMKTTSKTPLATSQRYGLTFAEAKTRIYVCMVLAAASHAFFGLGEDIAAIDPVLVLYIAFLFDVAVCMILQWVLSEWYASFLQGFCDGHHREC
jgi:hypothetical protein